jgi:hypothetical protein
MKDSTNPVKGRDKKKIQGVPHPYIRGGSEDDNENRLRLVRRSAVYGAGIDGNNIGFRLVKNKSKT